MTKTASVSVTLSLNAAAFHSASAKSPARCTATFTVADHLGGTDADPSNDSTRLVIDVSDGNDF